MSRRRIIENPRAFSGREEAERLRTTFQNEEPDREEDFAWSWPHELRCIGEGYAVMYRSNKWKKNKNEFENYKHVCESRDPWKLYTVPGFTASGVSLTGHTRAVSPKEMPANFAVLANCLGVQCRLFEKHGQRLVMPEGDEGIYEIQIPRSKLGSGRTRSGHLFLCVYVESEGPKLFIFGTELDVEKDGIVG